MKDFNEVAQSWLNGDFDPETKCKIIELRNNDPAGFEDAFYKNLEFGTGGLRGIMGQYSCLKNFMDRGAWRATVHGVTVRHD